MTEPEIDTAIDRAVRDLMNVDADGAFRARVTARLERPARGGFGWRHLALAGFAAAVLLAVVVFKQSPSDPVRPPIAEQTASPAPERAAVPSGAPPAPMTANREPGPVAARPPARRDLRQPAPAIARNMVVATVAPEGSAVEVEPLPTITPISMAPVGPRQIAPEAIVVAPLDPLAEIQPDPLTPRLERD